VEGEEARIVFPHHRAIRTFRAVSDHVVYFQDRSRRWYRAEVPGCLGLQWAHVIGFDTHGSSSFDRFSSIIVEGQRCRLLSLKTSGEPPRRVKKAKRGA
jgi:hypothetical protein